LLLFVNAVAASVAVWPDASDAETGGEMSMRKMELSYGLVPPESPPQAPSEIARHTTSGRTRLLAMLIEISLCRTRQQRVNLPDG